jgi:type IV pilus assembly protein PilF
MNRVLLPYSLYMCVGLVLTACSSVGGSSSAAAPVPNLVSRPAAPSASDLRKAATAHVELGFAYMDRGNVAVALEEGQKAIKADPAYVRGHLLLAMVSARQGQFDRATPEFEEAARLAPDDSEVGNAYGWYQCTQKQERQGLQRLEKVARDPYYQYPTRAWTNAGLCLQIMQDELGAEERFTRAVQVDEKNTQAQVQLAGIAYRTQRYVRAKSWVDRAQQNLRKPGADVYWLAARIERKLGNADTVRLYGSKLRQEFPESNEYQLFMQGKFE